MEIIIQILMLFIIINCLLRLSFWKPWQGIVFAVICAAFILWACQYAVLQSKTRLQDYLHNVKVMQNTAVVITFESIICIAYCFIALKSINGEKVKKWLKPLKWYPGLLVFPVLFYILTQVIYAMPGTDFSVISYIMAGAVLILIPATSYFSRYLFPEGEMRLEVYFLVSLFICLIGLITTVNDTVVYANADNSVNIKALILPAVLFVVVFLTGFVWDKVKWAIFRSNRLKKGNYKN